MPDDAWRRSVRGVRAGRTYVTIAAEDLLHDLGEERKARAIAAKIVAERAREPTGEPRTALRL